MKRTARDGRQFASLELDRRRFLASSAGAAATALVLPASEIEAIEPFDRPRKSHMKLSLAAFSYRQYLSGEQKSMDLFDFVTLAADLAVDAVELTSYYFPEDVDNDYLHRLREHAFLQGLDVSGTAVMNDFCLPPGPEADADLEHVRTWIDRAAELAAPVVRILSGNWIQGTPDEELEERVIARIEQLLPHARRRGVMLALDQDNKPGTATAEKELIVALERAHIDYVKVLWDGKDKGIDDALKAGQIVSYQE